MAVPRSMSISEGEWLGGGKVHHSKAMNKDTPDHSEETPLTLEGNGGLEGILQQSPQTSQVPKSPQAQSKEEVPGTSQAGSENQPHKDDKLPTEAPGSNRNSLAAAGADGIGLYLRPRNMSRAGSVYSLSRVSFSNQISQLTSIKLPDAASLSSSISNISNTPKAARALNDSADQIQSWIHKASDVLEGLDAGDDAEWAAAAGRDGLGQVDQAITRFESLIQVYVEAVEALQLRADASSIPAQDIQQVVLQVEKIVNEWQSIKNSLKSVKRQVELAMEWEELRDAVIQDIGVELEALSRLVFEMEEERHRAADAKEAHGDQSTNVDIAELETIVEEAPAAMKRLKRASTRFDGAQLLPPTSPLSPTSPTIAREDTNLLGLCARMQPLRASLDFLPMKFATFRNRASDVFPTACRDLDDRRRTLEEQWTRLEADAESLRKELGEDRWLLVFRNAGKQALRLIDSVSRAVTKLDESLDSNTQLRHATGTSKKIESYETKRKHYSPAIERIITTIERGVKDRLTVNGEIIRLQTELQQRWRTTVADVKNMDSTLAAYDGASTQQLRDSVSSILSSDRSFLSSTAVSRRSSSASSLGIASKRTSQITTEPAVPYTNGKPRQLSSASVTDPVTPASKRHSSLPVPTTPASSRIPRKTPLTRSSAHESNRSITLPNQQRMSAASTPRSSQSPELPLTPQSVPKLSPAPTRRSQPPSSSTPSKPRWNASTNLSRCDVGHNFKPLSATELSPYRKTFTPTRPQPRQTPPGSSSPLSRRTSTQFSSSPSSAPTSSARPRRPSSLYLSSTNSVSSPAPLSASTIGPESPLTPQRATNTARSASSLKALNTKRSSLTSQPRMRHSSANLKSPPANGSSNVIGGTRQTSRLSSGPNNKSSTISRSEG